jgi:hypothetical protein
MIPSQLIFERGPILLGSDTITLALAANLKVGLVKGSFTPGATLVYADVTLATFTGSTPLIPTPGTQPESVDPDNGDAIIDLVAPAGGWRWECTVDPSPAEQITGFIVYTTVGPTLYAAELLPDPITISAANQAIVLPRVALRFKAGSVI